MGAMAELPIRFETPVTLVGAGAAAPAAVEAARRLAPALVAADGGADRLAAMRLSPCAVIGDMDSLADHARWRAGPARFVHLAEQETTDFEKCLYATEAPLYLAVGFTGRFDHMLAVLHALLAYPSKRVVLIGAEEVSALAPPGGVLRLAVRPGSRVSIYPLLPVTGIHSRGLAWPLEGLALAPGQRIGTSNEARQPLIELGFDGPGALVMLEPDGLETLAAAISSPAR
jgi:thiamine pyrophosphokinase